LSVPRRGRRQDPNYDQVWGPDKFSHFRPSFHCSGDTVVIWVANFGLAVRAKTFWRTHTFSP
jgi:hypothetical protein